MRCLTISLLVWGVFLLRIWRGQASSRTTCQIWGEWIFFTGTNTSFLNSSTCLCSLSMWTFDMALLLTITKFRQKDDKSFDLMSLVNGVVNISYHVAVRCREPSVDLLWSRSGLLEVVGTRGRLFSVYSMAEAVNFQTNIDQHWCSPHAFPGCSTRQLSFKFPPTLRGKATLSWSSTQ